MKFFMFLFPFMGCFEPQPQYINTKEDNSDSHETSEDDTNDPSSNNSDNSNNPDNPDNPDNTEPDYQEPSSEPSSEPDLPTYSGGYNVNLCYPEAQTTGYAIGQVSGDFELIDQYGENLRLSDFCGNTVLLVAAAFW